MTEPARPDSVRLALPGEATAITAVQRSWLASIPALAGVLDDLAVDAMVSAWQAAITRPPLASYRVLVALNRAGDVVGFAAVGPSDDPDADFSDALVAEFCIKPGEIGLGHEDRLMHAVADTLRADGFTRATWWVATDDDITRAMLAESGWEPDGAHQEVGSEDGQLRVKRVRLHTALV